MRKGRLAIFFLVLLVIGISLVYSLTSLSSPIIIDVHFPVIDEEAETHTLIQKVALFTGLYTPQPPSGSNPSFIVRNSTGSNMFEIDHSGIGRVLYNFTANDTITTDALILNATAGATCPKLYNNATGCSIWESCDGSKYVLGCS